MNTQEEMFLKEFDEVEASEEIEFKEIPKGDYVCKITNSNVDKTKSPWRVSFEYTIQDGDFSGRKVFGNYSVDKKSGGFLKKDLKTLGIDNVSALNLEACVLKANRVENRLDCHIKPRVYNEKTYYNVYLNGFMEDIPSVDKNDELDF